MITLHMLDMSNPTGFDASAAQAAGIWGIAGYIGGDTPHVWTAEEWQQYVVNPGMRCVFLIYVPPQNRAAYSTQAGIAWAQEAMQAAQVAYDAGVPKTAALILDIEANMESFGSDAACQAWTTYLQSQHVPQGVYGPRSAFLRWPAVPEVAWVAQWPGTYGPGDWPNVATPAQGLASVEAWQFEGGTNLFGVSADRSVVTYTQMNELPPRITVSTVEPAPAPSEPAQSGIPSARVSQALQSLQTALSDAQQALNDVVNELQL
jgi:hypothetical protein